MRRTTLGGVLVMAVLAITVAGTAGAKPSPPAPVTVTIKSKPDPQALCPDCVTFFGAVHSPKPACVRKRVLEADLRIRHRGAAETYHETYFVKTDGRGRWSKLLALIDGQRILWAIVQVPKERVGRVLCRAAQAKVTL